MTIENKIEAILFYKNEPLTIKELVKYTSERESDVKDAVQRLSENLSNRGICLIMTETEVSLATAPLMKDLIEQITKDEMSKEIGKAGLETLAIILYNGPVSRKEIDYIRGVNSAFILRNLCIRGLVEKEINDKDQRTFKYKSSLTLLAHLGLKKVSELPDFEMLNEKTNELKNSSEKEDND